MATPEEGRAALEKLSQAVQEYVNTVDEEAPVVVRGWAIALETMIFRKDDGRAAYKIASVSGPETSNAHAMGLLQHGKDTIATCLLHHDECE